MRHGLADHRLDARAQHAYQPGLVLAVVRMCICVLRLRLAHQQRRHRRHEGEGEQEGTDQGQHEGRRHRVERLALHTFQGEDRREHQQDDQLAERRRARHLQRGIGGHAQPFHRGQRPAQFGAALAQHQQRRLDHDHRTVHQDAEVQCTQAHQVAADAEAVHADHREQERQRNHQRGDGGRAQVAQQQEQHHHHQQRALGEVPGHGLDGGIDQHTAVQHRCGHDVGRQRRVHLFQTCGCGLRHGAAVATGNHQRSAQHGLVAVAAGCTQARRAAQFHGGYIGHAHHHAIAGGHRRLCKILGGQRQAIGTHHQAFTGPLHEAGAGLHVGALQRGNQVGQAEAMRGQFGAVRMHAVFLDVAADRIDTGQPRAGAHLRRDDPVLHGAQVGRALFRRAQQVAFRRAVDLAGLPAGFTGLGQPGRIERGEVHRPHQHLAEAGGDRRQHRRRTIGQVFRCLAHAFGHLLAGEVDVGGIGEDRGDLREAIARQRTRGGQAGNAGQRGFQRIGHLPFDLLRGQRRGHRVDLHLAVGDVRHGVDRQLAQLEQAHGGDQRRHEHHQPAVAHRCFNDQLEHDRLLSGRARLRPWPARP
ncbi:hypothetical protein PAERUG_E15_London_28_01_14_08936 [Pseudomonas aeruginosa]|nr:hypothetical protein PAERUG_E15_London_28_01_14_08936 [Pseudomonas aeruginosa]